MATENTPQKEEMSQTQTNIKQYFNKEDIQTPNTNVAFQIVSEDIKSSNPAKRKLISDSPAEAESAVFQRQNQGNNDNVMTENQFAIIMSQLTKLENMQNETGKKLTKLDTIEQNLSFVIDKVTNLEAEINNIKIQKQTLQHEIGKLASEKDDIKTSLEYTQNEVESLKLVSEELRDTVKKASTQALSETNDMILAQAKLIRDEGLKQKQYIQRNNLIVTGVPEMGKTENCANLVDKIFYEHLWIDVANDIDKAHRLGKYRPNHHRPRPIIVRFVKHSAKEQVLHNKRYLKGTNYGISPHTVEDTHDDHQLLKHALTIVRRTDENAKVLGQKMLYQGKVYDIDQLKSKGIDLKDLHQRENPAEMHFLGRLSPMSNFHDCIIKDCDRTFTSAEQMYQYLKAKHHGDVKAMAAIMLCSTAKGAKEEGKSIHVPLGNDPDDMLRKYDAIMEQTLRCKFGQNQNLAHALKQTGTKVLYEASQFDVYWGSGIGLRDKGLFSKKKTGQNKLGQMLMHIRNEL